MAQRPNNSRIKEITVLFRYIRRGLGADPALAAALSREWGVTEITASILISRGVATAEAGRRFFSSSVEDFRDPFGLAGMAEAAERIQSAIVKGEKITVYGDYDVDGVCATAILTGYLRGRGADCFYYIPDRHTEGYGLNAAAVEKLNGTRLLVTVDCGISNPAEVKRARALGMDVIVTDHHECPDELPDCAAVVNPKRPGQAYGFAGLCGAGVAMKLVHALGGVLEAARALDLAALATVADIVPLSDENVAIVRLGLEMINHGGRPGIVALREASGLEGRQVKAGNIAFALAPRINAGGRMDLSAKSAEMLLTGDLARAREIARELNEDNAARTKAEEEMLEEAAEMVERDYSFSSRRAIVLYRPHWNTGVTGIVASRIVERYGRPAVLFGDGEGACYGSGRSVPGVHLYEALKACERFFTRYGGHEQAAGCALPAENIEPFAEALDKHLNDNYGEEIFLPARHYDMEIGLGDIDMALARDMEELEPAGFGNPRPVFLLRGAELAGLMKTADGKHLKMRFGHAGGLEGIAFRQGQLYDMLRGCSHCDALVVPDINNWMDRERVQAVVEHLLPPQGVDGAMEALTRAGAAMGRSLLQALETGGEGGGDAPERVPHAEGLRLLAEAVRRGCWGTLALFYTAHSAQAAIRALNEAGCLGRAYACAEAAHAAQRAENALVFAPDAAALPLHRYDNVFVFDGALSAGFAARLMARLNNGARCIIIDEEEGSFASDYFGREGLLGAYKALKTALLEGTGPRARGDWGFLDAGSGISPWRTEVSARIFVELGLLREMDCPPWLETMEADGRAALGASSVYRRLNGLEKGA
jgi:single-stranded-DNA-specific exonuclease